MSRLSSEQPDTVVLAPAGHLVDPDLGSDYERPWRLAEGLSKRGIRVVMVAREARRLRDLGPTVELESPPGPAPTSPVGKILDRANLYLHARRIAYRELAEGRVFVIHHLGPCGERSPSLLGNIPVPFVYGPVPASRPADPRDDEWLSWLRIPNATGVQVRLSKVVAVPAGLAAHRLWQRTVRRADAITVEAHTTMSDELPNVVVIRPGIDVRQFCPLTDGVPVTGRIIAVGRLIDRKGYDVLIRAIRLVIRSIPLAHVILVGSGPKEPTLRSLAKQLGIESSITFVGSVPRSKLAELLQSAEVFCHPATWESFFPAAPLEAMASGLPMLVSSAGTLPELIVNAGMVHEAGDSSQLARHLVEVLSNRGLRQALGGSARTRIIEQFTWQTMCDAYLDLYERLAESKRDSARTRT